MAKFAVIENETVFNIIEAESIEVAESITGHTCVEFTTEPAEPMGKYVDGKFIPVQPYPSWILDSEGYWQPPVPRPTELGLWQWDEETISWVLPEDTFVN